MGRVVELETQAFQQILIWGNSRTSQPSVSLSIRGGTGSGLPESTQAGFCVFLSEPDPDPESKICEKNVPGSGVTFPFRQ